MAAAAEEEEEGEELLRTFSAARHHPGASGVLLISTEWRWRIRRRAPRACWSRLGLLPPWPMKLKVVHRDASNDMKELSTEEVIGHASYTAMVDQPAS